MGKSQLSLEQYQNNRKANFTDFFSIIHQRHYGTPCQSSCNYHKVQSLFFYSLVSAAGYSCSCSTLSSFMFNFFPLNVCRYSTSRFFFFQTIKKQQEFFRFFGTNNEKNYKKVTCILSPFFVYGFLLACFMSVKGFMGSSFHCISVSSTVI